MFRTKVFQDKIKTHILCSVTFCRQWFRVWDNVENTSQQGRQHIIILGMHTACWIAPSMTTHVILIAFQWSSGCKNAPHCYVYTCAFSLSNAIRIHILSSKWSSNYSYSAFCIFFMEQLTLRSECMVRSSEGKFCVSRCCFWVVTRRGVANLPFLPTTHLYTNTVHSCVRYTDTVSCPESLTRIRNLLKSRME